MKYHNIRVLMNILEVGPAQRRAAVERLLDRMTSMEIAYARGMSWCGPAERSEHLEELFVGLLELRKLVRLEPYTPLNMVYGEALYEVRRWHSALRAKCQED